MKLVPAIGFLLVAIAYLVLAFIRGESYSSASIACIACALICVLRDEVHSKTHN